MFQFSTVGFNKNICTWVVLDNVVAVRFVWHCTGGPMYSEHLAMLNLEPLELHRLQFDLVMYHKILHSLMSIDVSSHFMYCYPPISYHSGSPKLFKPDKSSNNLMHSLFNRAADCGNNLLHTLRFCDSLSKFKGSLNNTDLSVYLTGI
jgi:hypothetical protein